jgi:NTP pyrophosphatase (non-canonical NTP hydrolase)
MTSEGGALSALQIANHGRDRYPTPKANAEKLVIEAAELLGAITEHNNSRTHQRNHSLTDCVLVRSELADVGLCLYALGNKLDIDPIEAMRELVDGDTRRFA